MDSSYFKYLKQKVQKSKSLDKRFTQSYNESLGKLQDTSGLTADNSTAIDVNLSAPQITDSDFQLRQLLSSFLKTDVIEKLISDPKLTPEMKDILVTNFYTDLAPKLQTFQGLKNISYHNILTALDKTANDIKNSQLQAEANEAIVDNSIKTKSIWEKKN